MKIICTQTKSHAPYVPHLVYGILASNMYLQHQGMQSPQMMPTMITVLMMKITYKIKMTTMNRAEYGENTTDNHIKDGTIVWGIWYMVTCKYGTMV